jgi:hypothetical protein
MTKNTSRLAAVIFAATLAMAASPAGAVVLPPLPPLPPLLPLLAVPHLVTHLLESLVPPVVVAPEAWCNDGYYGHQGYYGPQGYYGHQGYYAHQGYYGSQGYTPRGDRMRYPVRSMVPAPRVAPRTWNDPRSYGSQHYARGEERRVAGPREVRPQSRNGERRDHGENRDRWR